VSHPPFDLGAECRAIAREFGDVVGSAGADPGIAPSNIVILLPFALSHAFGLPLRAARAMALGNAFGAAHFLAQDRWLDGDEAAEPASVRLADVAFAQFVRAFQTLFPADDPFWGHFDRYIEECHASLGWERRVLLSREGGRAATGERLDETLVQAGRKMSPLKATVAGAATLAGRPDSIALGERIVEDYHAAYQLADDIEDAAVDLAAGRWSVAVWFLAARSGFSSPAAVDAGELFLAAARSGALEELVQLICARYRRAAADASELGGPIPEAHLNESLSHAERVLGRMARRLAITQADGLSPSHGSLPGPWSTGLHSFEVDGDAFVYDRGSGLFFEADGTAVDVLAWMRSGGADSGLEVLRLDHGASAVDEAVSELALLGSRAGGGASPAVGAVGGPSLSGLSSIALNVAGGCNLSCDYCYLGSGGEGPGGPGASTAERPRLMTDEVAFRAIDLLFDESFGERELSVVFFGGEPLLNAGLIARSARHARHRAARDARRVTFHVTTNGTLLTPDVAAMLHAEGVRVLVSIDGPAECHDSHRTFRNGAGSYETIAANISRLPDGMRPGARATVTEDSPPLAELVSHVRGLGFGVVHLSPVSEGPMARSFAERLVHEYEELARAERDALVRGDPPGAGCFMESVLSLELGRSRLRPCGAGARYVSVANDGALFLCHRFAGDERYGVGDVEDGLDRFAVGRLLAKMGRRSAACRECWALGLCGGACFYDVSLTTGPEESPAVGPRSNRCRVRLRTLELAMWLHASMSVEMKRRLSERARAAVRPEMETGWAPRARTTATTGLGVDEGR